MNVETITMDPQEARKKIESFGASLRRSADEEVAAAVAGYEALASGKALLDLEEVFRGAPLDDKGRPRFAIARADRKEVQYRHWTRDERRFFSTRRDGWIGHPDNSLCFGFPREVVAEGGHGQVTGYALVPFVPPDVLRHRSKLRRRFVLWEVEQWADRRSISLPDRDPFLLEHLSGALYIIQGAWDLTELERAIMRRRA